MTPEQIKNLPYRPCVGVMLVNARGHVFVGQRLDSKLDAWQMPQGGIDPGEEPREAVLRELWEETGVTQDLVDIEAESLNWVTYDLPHNLVPKLWKGRYRGQKQRWFLMRFHGADNQVIIKTEHPEFSEWKWLDPRDLVEKIVPFKREVYAQVLAEFGDRLG
ncbi:MAG: RNA pyrophosphohydrolase [Marinosulfonomonas sp.]|nr:RNA pyrophosphohydrolase [Marinosulfonomonas sp.]